MDELIRILAKNPDERTEAELEYLEKYADKLTEEQRAQLDKEAEVILETEEEVVEEEPQIKQKSNHDMIRKAFPMEAKALGEGEVEAIVASEALDRHGEIVDIKGLDIKNYMKNPVVAWGHNYNEPAIGKTTKLVKTADGKLIATMKFAVSEYEKARVVYNLIKGGYLNAFSIGFIPYEMDGNRYTKSEMIEFSSVLVPANAEALVLAKSKGIDTDILSSYDLAMKYDLSKILEKSVEDLTVGEVKFLKENVAKLSDENKAKYAEVLETKDVLGDVSELLEKKFAEFKKELDTVEVKDISTKGNPNKPVIESDMSKEEKFKLWASCLQKGDFSDYKARVKDAMNTGDTSAVVPPTEFIAEVERLEEEYGVARQFAKVRRTSKSSITVILGDDDLDVYDTAEGGRKTSTKLGYEQQVLTFRKFASILPITDELNEESAIDLWNDATRRYARAFARKEDEMVFTRANGGTNLYPGILNASGVNEVVIDGDSFEDISFDDLNNMIYGVPTASMNRGRFWLNREMLGVIQRIKNPTTGEYVWKPSPATGAEPTIWGRPYTLVEVMPNLTDDAEDTPFIAFGDLSYVTLGMRTDMQIKIFDSGIVGDPDEEDQEANTLNLLTQDMQAMRAVKRMNARVRFPSAFSVARTATSGS